MPPLIIRDEMLEVYAFVFCQGGFRQLGMTFEQFLLVAAAIKAPDLTTWRGRLPKRFSAAGGGVRRNLADEFVRMAANSP
jgi:hypothetical protein